MTSTQTEPDPPATDLRRTPRDRRQARIDTGFRWIALMAGLSVLGILALIAVSTTQKGWPAFRQLGGKYFFGAHWVPANEPVRHPAAGLRHGRSSP